MASEGEDKPERPATEGTSAGAWPLQSEITDLLREIQSLDCEAARNRLFDAVYSELRQMAGSLMRQERSDHTFRPTDLVHEAFVHLVEQNDVTWENRAHFFGIAARVMRHILVDHARKKASLKRGGDRTRVTLEGVVSNTECSMDLLIIQEALERLAGLDERAAKVAELRIFGGLTSREIAAVLGCSRRTADTDWIAARSWLSRELSSGAHRP
jgi:RNA polymerase sigma factor (TIGR02999 family)